MNPVTKPVAPEEGVPPRRLVLRGALAAGCSLLLPTALLGCQKQPSETAGEAAPAPGPEPAAPAPPAGAPEAAAPASPDAPATAKVSKASVQYQTEPKDGQKCADCLHFVAESNTCKLVEGDISPNGWCQLWAKRA